MNTIPCYCGSNTYFHLCCHPYILGENTPEIPEQLMRSRYSAYATNNAKYIFNTYAQSKQKENTLDDIIQWAQNTHWLKLVVNYSTPQRLANFSSENLPTVSFDAYYIHQQQLYKMSECSRFIVEQGQWRYLEGDVAEHIKLIRPKRNDLCFCLSGKKFKKCCGQNL